MNQSKDHREAKEIETKKEEDWLISFGCFEYKDLSNGIILAQIWIQAKVDRRNLFANIGPAPAHHPVDKCRNSNISFENHSHS